MFVLVDHNGRVTAVSDRPIRVEGHQCVPVRQFEGDWDDLIGKKVANGGVVMSVSPKPVSELRVAVICNWNDRCGISTYSKYLVSALRPKVKSLQVFSEITDKPTDNDENFVTRCWKRGQRLKEMVKAVRDWQPDFVIIQHEFGIFPNAVHFFQMIQSFADLPYAVVMHSVYEHLDKSVYASVSNNIIVHSEQGKRVLRGKGNTSNIWTIPHGCIPALPREELWNILHTPYSIMQFGFGFRYKGVDRMLEAVALLKNKYPDKYGDIFYCMFLSNNGHNDRAHEEYYQSLMDRVSELGIEDNVAIICKYNSEQMLGLYLRMFKLAVFPYVSSPENTVYGATGAARIALAHGIPVIASNSHLFDDLEGVVPRPATVEDLAKEIGKVFSDGKHRQALVDAQRDYVENHSWDNTADAYLQVYREIVG